MNQTRAFSDTEIVTIAAVAASALGGIVIGLGRGQEDSGNTAGAAEGRLQAGLGRALGATSDSARALRNRDLPVSASDVRRVYGEARPAAKSAARKVRGSSDVSSSLSALLSRGGVERKPQASILGDVVKSVVSTALEAGMERARGVDTDQLKSNLTRAVDKLGSASAGSDSAAAASADGPEMPGVAAEVAERVSTELEALEEKAAAAPETVRAAADQTRELVSKRVARPVSRAATSTGDVTKESLAALAWLSLGACVVYFGLLSDERREQVKDGLCGVIEQGRLLMLDFQGYEPEM